MSKPLTYIKPNGEWGLEGVDLAALPPRVYGALCKLRDLEHPAIVTRADAMQAGTVEDMARMLAPGCCYPDYGAEPCLPGGCPACWQRWLEGDPRTVDKTGDAHCRACICQTCDLRGTEGCLEGAALCEAKCDRESHTSACPWHPGENGG